MSDKTANNYYALKSMWFDYVRLLLIKSCLEGLQRKLL